MPKFNRSRNPKGLVPTASDTISDSRFTNIQTDPRFRLPSKRSTHVRLDQRFAPILEDDAFSSTAKVDRYGRKLQKGTRKKELEKFYRIEDEKVEKGEGAEQEGAIDDETVERELERLDGQEELVQDGEDESEESQSSSDGEDSEMEDAQDDDAVFGPFEDAEDGREGIPKGEISSRLAVVNLDWDNIRATDLMAVFQSFVPTNGRILNITIYPSEYGKERMEREELEGPPKEIFAKKKSKPTNSMEDDDRPDLEGGDSGDDDEKIKQSLVKADDGAEFSSTLLRRYQLSRLRYYYAVLVCSSPSVASAIYDAVDGTEYLTTANFFDLRYVPDETNFDDDTPRDECKRLPDGYRPNDFVTDALQHSKVKLTWDADDGARKDLQKRAFGGSRKEVDENDLRAYLGSDSEDDDDYNDDDDNNATKPAHFEAVTGIGGGDMTTTSTQEPDKLSKKEAERQRMRALLGLSAEPAARKLKADKAAPVGDMQITFTSGLSADPDGAKKHSVFENEPELEETTVEKYVRKERERKARRREKMKQKGSSTSEQVKDMNEDNGTDIARVGKGSAKERKDDSEDDDDEDEDDDDEDEDDDDEDEDDDKVDDKDLGFNDPFFTTSTATNASTTKTTSARKADDRKRKAAELPPSPTADLDNNTNNNEIDESSEIKHFNLTALTRAAKLNPTLNPKKSKLKRKRNLSERDKEALAAQKSDTFKMNVHDARFSQLYESAEFAVDPSHPRYRDSEGMREVLKEGRVRRRKREGDEDGEKEKLGIEGKRVRR